MLKREIKTTGGITAKCSSGLCRKVGGTTNAAPFGSYLVKYKGSYREYVSCEHQGRGIWGSQVSHIADSAILY